MEAVDYLMKGWFDEDAKKLVDFFGGRFVYLTVCVAMQRLFHIRGIAIDTELIKQGISKRKLNDQRMIIISSKHAPFILENIGLFYHLNLHKMMM